MVLRESWLRLIEEQSQVVSDLLSQISVISREVNKWERGNITISFTQARGQITTFSLNNLKESMDFYLQTQEYLQKSLEFHQLCCQ